MREAVNYCYIEGILSEVNLKEVSYVKNNSNVEAMSGEVIVRVENQDGVVEIPVSLFANKMTKDGKVSKGYLGLKDVKDNFKSIANTGSVTEADKIRISGSRNFSNAALENREFYNKDGKLVNSVRVKATYVYKVEGEFKPRAEWTSEFMVAGMNDRVDKDGVELNPRELEVKVVVPTYNDNVNMFTFIVKNPQAIKAIEDGWELNHCYSASGKLNFTSTTRTVMEEADFGDPIEKIYTNSIREIIVQRGSVTPMDEEDSWSPADIKNAIAAHKAALEAKKDKGVTKEAPVKDDTPFDLGF